MFLFFFKELFEGFRGTLTKFGKLLKSNVENNDNASASNLKFSQNCGSVAKHLNYLLADYGPSLELHVAYSIQLYIHISCTVPRFFVLCIDGQFRDFPG